MKRNWRAATRRTPKNRERQVSFALRAYASLATSADKGAVRDKSKLGISSMAVSQPLPSALRRGISASGTALAGLRVAQVTPLQAMSKISSRLGNTILVKREDRQPRTASSCAGPMR